MPLGLGTTVDYIFFSAESCENGNRTGKPVDPGFIEAILRSPWEQLMVGQAFGHMAWAAGKRADSQKSKFHTFLALVILIIIPLGHLPAFSFYLCSIRERWAEPALPLFKR